MYVPPSPFRLNVIHILSIAGNAGGVVASRLTEDLTVNVLVIEGQFSKLALSTSGQ